MQVQSRRQRPRSESCGAVVRRRSGYELARRGLLLALVDLNAATTEQGCNSRGVRRIRILRDTKLVVVHDRDAVRGGDLDAEGIRALARRPCITINRRDQELVAAHTIERAGSLELRTGAGNHQPLVDRALEVDPARPELEFGVS